MSLKGKKIAVGLTGGIACYKVPYLVRALRKAEAEVVVIMTEAATKFITPLTLETVSDNPVAIEMFPDGEYVSTRHIDLAEWPDLHVIAPATANLLGKVANGICDDLLTTVICAAAGPVMIAPAMNVHMWANPITQANFERLKELGYLFVDPGEGEMACDDYGVGRMAEPDVIFDAITAFFSRKSKKKVLTGKRFLVTAGATREPIDPVRFITNRSSGRMGYALAEAAVALGAETTLISGPVSLKPPPGVKLIAVESTAEMARTVKREFKKSDCLIMAAAPADYAPVSRAGQKIKKSSGALKLDLSPTVDILREIGKLKRDDQRVIGFALETEDGLANARRKLKEKNLDMIVLNSPGEQTGFDHDTNAVTVLMPGKKPASLPLASKMEIAGKLLDYISRLI